MSGRLGSFQRSFSGGSAAAAPRPAPDAPDSDELGEDEWPATQRPPMASRPVNVSAPPARAVAGSSKPSTSAGPPKQRAWTAPKAAFASDGNADRSGAMWAQRAADRKAGGSASASTSKAAPPAVLHKRVFPWDSIEDAAEPSAKRIALDRGESGGGSGARSFSALGGRSRSGSPAPGAGSSTLNIRQKVTLSSEQQQVLKLVVSGGQSVFFTGSAGPSALPTALR